MWPAMVNLMMNVGYIPQSVRELHKFKNSKEIQGLIKGLESHGIKYDFALLFENQDYLKSKKDALRIKTET